MRPAPARPDRRDDAGDGLEKIAAARKRVAKVRRLLLALGEPDEKRALIQRYARAMSAPADLSAGKEPPA